MAGDINLRVLAETKKAVDNFGKLVRSIEETKKEAADASERLAKIGTAVGAGVGAATVAIAGMTAAVIALADRGETVGSVAEGFEKLGGTASVIDEASEKTLGLVTSFELMQLANKGLVAGLPDINENFDDIAEAGARLANTLGKDTKGTIEQLTNAIATGRQVQLQQLGIMVDAKAETEKYAAAQGIAAGEVDELTRKQLIQNAAIEEVKRLNGELADVTISVANAYEVVKNRISDVIDTGAVAINANTRLSDSLVRIGDSIKDLDLATLGDNLANLTAGVVDLVSRALPVLLKFLNNAVLSTSVLIKLAQQLANKQLPDLDLAIQDVVIDMRVAQVESAKLAKEQGTLSENTEIVTGAIDRATGSIGKLGEASKKAKDKVGKIFGPGNAKGIAEFEKNAPGIIGSLLGVGKDLEGSIENELANALGSVLSGGSIRDSLSGAGGGIGSAAGATIGGPIGAAIGQQIGQGIGDSLAKLGTSREGTVGGIVDLLIPGGSFLGIGDTIGEALFGNKNAEANAREAFVDFINNAIDENEVQLIIDDKLQSLDFDIAGGRQAFADGAGPLDGLLFGTLGDSASVAFKGVGLAFNELLDTGEDIGEQLGAIFAENLGGDLNNLQLLLGELGVSAEQLKEQVLELFLDSKISAIEALDSIRGIEEVFTRGIPGAIGATNKAFDNLVAGAGRGRQAVDAVGDIFAEAKEKGIESLDALKEDLISLGAPIEQVEQLFQAFAAAGITSIEDGLGRSLEGLLPVLADLEANSFEFQGSLEKAAQDVDEVLNRLENAPRDLRTKWTIDVEVTGDPVPQEVNNASTAIQTFGK